MSDDLVVFGEDWGAHPSSTQHLVRRLGLGRRIVWVNSIGLRRPRPCLGDLRRTAGKMAAALRARPVTASPAREWAPDRIVAPIAVPWPGSRVAGTFNRCVVGRQVRKAMAGLDVRRPILWTSLPSAVDILGAAGERAVVYYCGDDFSALAGVDHAAVAAQELLLAGRADLIIAASPVLAARFPAGKTVVVPHGADVTLFSNPAPKPADLPDAMPVAGFYGSLSAWIDVDLVAGVARRMPDWCFFLIGPVRTDVSALAGLPNVMLAGPRGHGALPGYAQHWAASLLPFRDNAQIRACNPLKLREYLAAGAPVVTTDFPALDGYRDLVNVVRDAEQMVQALRSAREMGGEIRGMRSRVDIEGRRARVAGETWEARAADVERLLEALA